MKPNDFIPILLKEGFVEVDKNELRKGFIFDELIEYYARFSEDGEKEWKNFIR